jgi:hypothetical protein
MATYTKVKLSGSTDGRPVAVAATATPGTTIHTAHATALDEILLVASNIDTSDRDLTIEHGGTATSDNLKITIPAQSIVELPAFVLTNSLVLKAFASSANKINIAGAVNRIT